MIINGESLLNAAPILNMEISKVRQEGVSYGLSEAGYDIRIKQTIAFMKDVETGTRTVGVKDNQGNLFFAYGRFALASAIEEFRMPDNLVGIVHDKSTWARQGLSVFNTVIEPGWDGFLTLELVHHGDNTLIIPAGSGIAQVVFHETKCLTSYSGKYNHQPDHPVEAIFK